MKNIQVAKKGACCYEGFNDSICSFFICFDLSERSEGARLATWQSAFDRYTGRSFEFDSSSLTDGEDMTGSVQFDYRENHYDVQTT